MRRLLLFFLLSAYSVISIAQIDSITERKLLQTDSIKVLNQILHDYDSTLDEKFEYSTRFRSLNDFSIRLFSLNPKMKITYIEIKSSKAEINQYVVENNSFIKLSWVLNNEITIGYNNGGNSGSYLWVPPDTSSKMKLKQFEEDLYKLGIRTENLDDYHLYQCVEPNTMIKIRIYYTYKLISNAFNEQKFMESDCFIDNNGVITLPDFFDSINSYIDPDVRDNDSHLWFDANKIFHKIKLVTEDLYGGFNRISVNDAERIISNYYYNRIGAQEEISSINATIIPDRSTTNITIYHDGNKFELPYIKNSLRYFLSRNEVCDQIGFRGNSFKAVVYPKKTVSSTNHRIEVKYRRFCKKKGRNPILKPGDIIYLK
jgi:hypothetical protein